MSQETHKEWLIKTFGQDKYDQMKEVLGPYNYDEFYLGTKGWMTNYINRNIYGVDINAAAYRYSYLYAVGGSSENRFQADSGMLADMHYFINQHNWSWWQPNWIMRLLAGRKANKFYEILKEQGYQFWGQREEIEEDKDHPKEPVPGWIGGFPESNPEFAYPNPDLSSLPFLDNMDNIDLLQRQQNIRWPEFSWETDPGDPESRCFIMFAPNISRIGYTNEGRIYSIICPQIGFMSPSIGCINAEVTVTGQKGWIDEPTKELAAEMTVVVKIWFSPSAQQSTFFKILWEIFKDSESLFPSSKAKAIQVKTHHPTDSSIVNFPVRTGETELFQSPDFARHPEAWAVGNIQVEVGDIVKTGNPIIDEFNELVVDIYNLVSGNMLKKGNDLSWNIWLEAPTYVDNEEWREHAEKWRESLEADHGSPDGPGTKSRYFDGEFFSPTEELLDEERARIRNFIKAKLSPEKFFEFGLDLLG